MGLPKKMKKDSVKSDNTDSGLTRRDFLKASGAAAGTAILWEYGEKNVMAQEKFPVSLASGPDRGEGVKKSVQALGVNPVKGRDVLIKPNLNTADPAPGSTHNDVLAALIKEIWALGAKTITVGERSFPPTAEVLEAKKIPQLLKELDARLINFDDLPSKDWIEQRPADSHWRNGFRIARPILESECLVYTCCLKTHQYGGVITMSLKNSVGVVPTHRHGFDYMRELHSSPHQRRMIAEINLPFKPALTVMDGVEAFVDGGPMEGKRVRGDIVLASTSRTAMDIVGTAVLKALGSNSAIMGRKIYEQEQISRAVELGMGPRSPEQIDITVEGENKEERRDQLQSILQQG